MRHRYIFSGLVSGTDEISDFRLISSATRFSLGQLIRVNIPDDLKLNHYSGDSYSTTWDKRTLNELGYDCYIVYEGKWRKFNALKEFQPHEWFEVLERIYGLFDCGEYGYTRDYNRYDKYLKDGINGVVPFKSESEILYPQFKECKKDLNLDIHLRIYVSDDCEDAWYKKYLEYKKTNPIYDYDK